MSQQINDNLLEEAEFYRDYFSGTPMEKMLQNDIKTNDLEQLQVHLKEAREAAWLEEFRPAMEAGL